MSKKPAAGAKKTSNLQVLLDGKAIEPDAAAVLNAAAKKRIEKLSKAEVRALISAHLIVSPKKRWRPDPDGSIF